MNPKIRPKDDLSRPPGKRIPSSFGRRGLKLRIGLCVVCLLVLSSPLQAAPGEDFEALTKLMQEFAAAYEGRSIDALMKTFVDSDEVTLFLPNPFVPMSIQGRANVRKVIETFFESLPGTARFRMTTHDNSYNIYGDLAVNYNYTNIYLHVGGLAQKYIARTTNIFKKQQGSWRIIHIHGTPFPKESSYFTRPVN